MSITTIPNDLRVQGHIACQSMSIPAGTIHGDDFASDADVEVEYLEHEHVAKYVQNEGSDVATQTQLIYTCKAASGGLIRKLFITPSTAPTGGDKQFTVDVKKSTGGGAFATILSGVVTISSADTSRVQQDATSSVNTDTLVTGDILQIVITASGSTGSQGQGVLVEVVVDEFTS